MSWEFASAQGVFVSSDNGLSQEWDALNASLFKDHPLLCSAFVGPLVRHFGTPDLLLGRSCQNGNTQALVLLQRRTAGLWQTFLPGQAPVSPVLLGHDFNMSAFLRALPGFSTGIDFLCQDPHYSALADTTLPGCREQHPYCTTTAVSLDASFEQYWSLRARNLRKNMKRYLSRATDNGQTTTLRVVTGHADLPAALDRYGVLESAGWKGQAGTAIHPENQQGRFYADVLTGFSGSNGARVYELYLGDHLAASRLCVAKGGMLVVLKTTYDETLSQLAPGRILLHMLLEREFKQKDFTTVEFYTNASHDSISWSTTTREISHVSYYRHATIRGLIAGSRNLRHKFKQAVDVRKGASSRQPG